MKTIAYILLVVGGLMLIALLFFLIQLAIAQLVLGQHFIIIIPGGIICFGLIGRVIFVAIDSYKKDKLRR
ncbi:MULTISPECIES: hypothetical protein [unclassified Arcicella]|uniref:hypothetical protein n=1 Tax=unclassified Arcicella TaxID=2644986 RepID=UPI00285CAB95|nr:MULTISPECIES: hypothetical protein [unclassified Arcicella]MDR6560813.1 putative lipid-binding transport protein (Tim44 family) [Arcicella sp. BE51]MDR6810697.1 putative lipid-binding transport protein (Tim44 family) [Arcicella sp. BE140]MDR6822047.1 putative lipid-binding transport protein (Tim44 family) [Arcicella sp. BE139]